MHQNQKLLLKAEKNFSNLMEIFLRLADGYEVGTKELKELSNKYVELLQTMKSQIQSYIVFDWDKYEEEHKATIDIDRIKTSVETKPEIDNEKLMDKDIKDAFEMLSREQAQVNINDLIEKSGVFDKFVLEWVEKKKRNGDLFEPKRGFIQKV